MKRALRADLLLAENIRTLLARRNQDAGALAMWCGHGASWISKFLGGGRGVRLKDLGRIADFFGLTVAELFQHGISHLAERRAGSDRRQRERRTGRDRREDSRSGRLHPDTINDRFPPRRSPSGQDQESA